MRDEKVGSERAAPASTPAAQRKRAIMGKPEVGHRVTTKLRIKAGVRIRDAGEIIRIEDGGYCVVRWDSDGESTSVLMMSLGPVSTPGEAAQTELSQCCNANLWLYTADLSLYYVCSKCHRFIPHKEAALPQTCPSCGHGPHEPGACLNMASDSDCACTFPAEATAEVEAPLMDCPMCEGCGKVEKTDPEIDILLRTRNTSRDPANLLADNLEHAGFQNVVADGPLVTFYFHNQQYQVRCVAAPPAKPAPEPSYCPTCNVFCVLPNHCDNCGGRLVVAPAPEGPPPERVWLHTTELSLYDTHKCDCGEAVEYARVSPSATGDWSDGSPSDAEQEAREIIQHISDASLELAFTRHDLTSDEVVVDDNADVKTRVQAVEQFCEEVKQGELYT